MYIIELKKNSKVIGLRNVMLDLKILVNDHTELGEEDNVISEIIINENYWNNGYATEASKAIFSLLKEHKIKNVLTFISKNSQKSYQMDTNLGFKEYSFFDTVWKFKYFPDCVRNTIDLNNQRFMIKKL